MLKGHGSFDFIARVGTSFPGMTKSNQYIIKHVMRKVIAI